MNSIRPTDDCSGGASRVVLRLRPCLHLVPSILVAINPSPKARVKEMERRMEERSLHPLGPLRRQPRHHDPVPPWRSCKVSVGSSVALRQADTLSSSCCARTEVILSTSAIPFPASPLQKLCWAVVAGLCALLREVHECVRGLNNPGDFTSSWYLDVNAATPSGWAFTYRNILHSLNLLKRLEELEVRGSSFEASRWQGLRFFGTSVSSAATGAFAPLRKPHVSLPTSGVNAPSLAHICGDVALSHFDGMNVRHLSECKSRGQ